MCGVCGTSVRIEQQECGNMLKRRLGDLAKEGTAKVKMSSPTTLHQHLLSEKKSSVHELIAQRHLATANLRTKILEFSGFDSSINLNSRGGILMSIGNSPEILSQRTLVGVLLEGRLGVCPPPLRPSSLQKYARRLRHSWRKRRLSRAR